MTAHFYSEGNRSRSTAEYNHQGWEQEKQLQLLTHHLHRACHFSQEVIAEPKPEVLIDDKELDPGEKDKELVVPEEVTVDTPEIVEDPYVKGEMVSVDGSVGERAIGHDGHYDSASGQWMLEEDWHYEPEWRCLMRPLLRASVKGVSGAFSH